MKHNRRRSPGKPRVSPTVLDRINADVAGIDCGAAEHFVAVPPDRDATPVQCFQTFTGDLVRLAAWLTTCRVQSVAMEATGVYWIPIYALLEARGFEVLLVNARHLKNVTGRKRDVSDCEWIRELHSVGLLRGSFRPPDALVALRAYLRHRQTLIESAGTSIQRLQKALSLARTLSDSLRSPEIRQSVHRPKTARLVGGRTTGIIRRWPCTVTPESRLEDGAWAG